MRGGVVVHHYAKRIIYMDQREAKDLRDYRRMWIVRTGADAKFSDVIGLKIGSLGFEEVDVQNLLTDTEKGRVE
jgi:ribosomal protein L20